MKLMPQLLICFFLSSLAMNVHGQQLNNITPVPVDLQVLEGSGTILTNGSTVAADALFENQIEYFRQQVASQCGIRIDIHGKNDQGFTILFQKDVNGITREEMYRIEIKTGKVFVKARSIKGVMNAMQTLLQLLPIGKTASATLPPCIIVDYPRFSYRGMHLDVVRHFFPVGYIKKYIDYLTFHKFNYFHWHLTDDQGWRIEIKSYPKLNSIGSWRDSTLIGHFKDQPARYDHTRYGGYYSREEVKEIIRYAAIRGITIIPEIDIPGHSRATITAYPELSTDPKATWGVAATWGMYNRQNNVLAPTPATFEFLRKVFQEIADLFPSPYIHVGGDECSKLWWKQSEATQKFIREKKLKSEAGLQNYFIEQVALYLREKKKKIIGWHEVMEGHPDRSTVIMNWSNDAKANEAARQGYTVIMTPSKPYYFDSYQSKDPNDSLAIHGYNPLESVYRYDPLPPAVVQTGNTEKIWGGQANVWTEYIAYPSKVDYMVFPRMTALSEALWSPTGKKNYEDFIRRLKNSVIPRYRYWGSSWFPEFEKWKAE